jgi:hypothetical protein
MPKVSIIGRKVAIAKAVKTDLRLLKRSMSCRCWKRKKTSISHLFTAKVSALRECMTSIRYAAQGPNPISTPRPMKKKHIRLINKPSSPSTNRFTKAKTKTDKGIMTPNGINDALKRSSGYQTPPRFLRHVITVQSETLPAIAAPTGK